MIENENWLKAQEAERRYHTAPFEIGLKMYYQSYSQYFAHLGMSFDCAGKSIIEIGPADYPALTYCRNYSRGYIIEPMPSSILKELIAGTGLQHFALPSEQISWDESFGRVDEVWLFNVLQHVKDPDIIINQCKEHAARICFFEPINCGTNVAHLWSFDLEYFQKHFGDCVKHYPGNPNAVNFHTHECAYGIWEKGE